MWCAHDPEVTGPTRAKKHLQIHPVGYDSTPVTLASTLFLSQLFQRLPDSRLFEAQRTPSGCQRTGHVEGFHVGSQVFTVESAFHV